MKNLNVVSVGTLAVALVALLAGPVLAHDHADSPVDADDHATSDKADEAEAFDQMVRGIDVLPDRQAMEDRWPDADQRLIATATDPERSEFVRWRATSLLGNFVEDHVEQTLVELTDDSVDRVRAMAYYTLGTSFLHKGDDELFELLEEGLDDDTQRVTSRILRSFGWTDHPEARVVLEEVVASDKDEDLKSHARRALDRHD